MKLANDFAGLPRIAHRSKSPEISEVGKNKHNIQYIFFSGGVGGGGHRIEGGYRIVRGAKSESVLRQNLNLSIVIFLNFFICLFFISYTYFYVPP